MGLSCACNTPLKRKKAAHNKFLMQDARLCSQAAIYPASSNAEN